MIMFPQKVKDRWLVLSWNKEVLHTQVYKTFVRALLEYNKGVKNEHQH